MHQPISCLARVCAVSRFKWQALSESAGSPSKPVNRPAMHLLRFGRVGSRPETRLRAKNRQHRLGHPPPSPDQPSLLSKAQPLIRNNQRSKHRKRPAVCCFQIGKQPRAAPTSPSRVMCCGNWSAASGCEQGVPKPHDKRQPCCHTRGYALTSQLHPRAETHNNIRGERHAPFRVCSRSSYP